MAGSSAQPFPGRDAAAAPVRRVATVGIVRSRNAKKPAAVADQRPVQGEDGIPLARVSRSPRILPFVLTGLVLGVVVGLVIDHRR